MLKPLSIRTFSASKLPETTPTSWGTSGSYPQYVDSLGIGEILWIAVDYSRLVALTGSEAAVRLAALP
jgi:hypothetical protein